MLLMVLKAPRFYEVTDIIIQYIGRDRNKYFNNINIVILQIKRRDVFEKAQKYFRDMRFKYCFLISKVCLWWVMYSN